MQKDQQQSWISIRLQCTETSFTSDYFTKKILTCQIHFVNYYLLICHIVCVCVFLRCKNKKKIYQDFHCAVEEMLQLCQLQWEWFPIIFSMTLCNFLVCLLFFLLLIIFFHFFFTFSLEFNWACVDEAQNKIKIKIKKRYFVRSCWI
jgi:hypothetical protein